MHPYTITDRVTGERTSLIAPNRDAALKAYVNRRLTVARDKAPTSTAQQIARSAQQLAASAMSAVTFGNHDGTPKEPD